MFESDRAYKIQTQNIIHAFLADFLAGFLTLGAAFLATFFGAAFFGAAFLATFLGAFLTGANI